MEHTIPDLHKIIEQQQAVIVSLQATIVRLEARIALLERQLELTSSTSSKPPSSDGFKRTQSLREKSGKVSGGQNGHEGFTLKMSDVVDEVLVHRPLRCEGCGEAFSPEQAADSISKRQVFDLPLPKMVVTEHQSHKLCCSICGLFTNGKFPKDVNAPTQYGARVQGVVTCLAVEHHLPEQRLANILEQFFGIKLTKASIGNIIARQAGRLSDAAAQIEAAIAKASVKHLDESSLNVTAKTFWLHVMSTTFLTHYRVSEKRGALPQITSGIVVHDHWKPYFRLESVLHALCNAHHLRELNALIAFEKEDWAGQMKALLLESLKITDCAKLSDETSLPLREKHELEQRYDDIVSNGLAFHETQPAFAPLKQGKRGRPKRRIGHNLLLRLQNFKAETLRFMEDFSVPFTNNQAERDIRPLKTHMKVSGCFRSMQGAKNFAILKAIIQSAKKQNINFIQAINNPSLIAF